LMFDMNNLWERWVVRQLRRSSGPEVIIKSQASQVFWKSEKSRKRLKPDILLYRRGKLHPFLIIDTKWKTPASGYPSDEDLRQIYAYLSLFNCGKGVLLYPGANESILGIYLDDTSRTCEQRKINVLGEGNKLIAGWGAEEFVWGG
jgi:5-methylcytosine-specific restriction enzyme subunit McrC